MLLPVVALFLGFLFPGSAVATGHDDLGPNLGADDESIGTLPILGDQDPLVFVRHTRDARPAYYLEGSYGELISTIVGLSGSGTVTRENLADGRVRLGFHGRVQLALDSGLLQVTGIQIGMNVPAAYRSGQASTWFEGRESPAYALRQGNLALPVSALDALGALEQSPWILSAHSRTQGNYQFRAQADAGLLFVGQSY
jgi:hypothetical protein